MGCGAATAEAVARATGAPPVAPWPLAGLRRPESLRDDWTGSSVFLRNGDEAFHTYSTYARGMDQLAILYTFLDLTPYGRQEDWEDSPAGWSQQPTYG